MRTDQARIAIRERLWTENLDLALQVIRTHFAPLVVAAAIGIAPMMFFNLLIIISMFDLEFAGNFEVYGVLTILVLIQAPLATALVTLYLGQIMFTERPDVKRIARELAGSLPQLLLLQVFVRGMLIVPVLSWIIPYAVFPYLNELILLERYPLFSRGGQLSTSKRISVLHRGGSADYLARALGAGCISLGLFVALWFSQVYLVRHVFDVEPAHVTQFMMGQLAMWIVAAYFAVARFLSYLDQRIRYEGWEIELALRAQRDRFQRKVA